MNKTASRAERRVGQRGGTSRFQAGGGAARELPSLAENRGGVVVRVNAATIYIHIYTYIYIYIYIYICMYIYIYLYMYA